MESTTYPGTTNQLLRPILERDGLQAGQDFFLAFSPEREDPGNPDYSTSTIPKVVGGVDPASGRLAVALYRPVVTGVVPVASAEVAEACKILENTYRAVNIALVNELKILYDRMGIDVWEVIETAKTKPFGFMPFYPGPGIGGHCIPLDPHYLSWKARQHGFDSRFIGLAEEVNSRMPEHVVQLVSDGLNDAEKPLKGSRVLLLGVAYKKDINDVRESPALSIIDLLRAKGARVSYHDPFVSEVRFDDAHTQSAGDPLQSITLTDEELRASDCVVIVTDHSPINYRRITELAPLIVDTRNALNGELRRESRARIIRL